MPVPEFGSTIERLLWISTALREATPVYANTPKKKTDLPAGALVLDVGDSIAGEIVYVEQINTAFGPAEAHLLDGVYIANGKPPKPGMYRFTYIGTVLDGFISRRRPAIGGTVAVTRSVDRPSKDSSFDDYHDFATAYEGPARPVEDPGTVSHGDDEEPF